MYGQIPELQIITPEDFDKANKQMRENSLFQSNAPKYYNPLKGLLFCPCGCGLYMKPNHNSYLIYRCSSAYNDKQKCENYGVKMRLYPIVRLDLCKGNLAHRGIQALQYQRANELQGINKQIRETITRKVNSVDELKTDNQASLIAKSRN